MSSGIARERRPPERPLPFAEQRSDERRHEPRVGVRAIVRQPADLGARTQVVPVVEHHRAAVQEPDHRAHVLGHRDVGAALILRGVGGPQRGGLGEREPGRHVAAERIVRARLIGHDVGLPTTPEQLRLDLGAVAHQADRDGLAARLGLVDPRERRVQVVGLAVQVPRLHAAFDPRGVDLDAQGDPSVHGDGQRLRAAHPAEPAGERDRAPQRPAEPLMRALGQRLVGPLQDPLGPDVDPGARGHLSVHGEPGRLELAERVPIRPLGHEHGVGDQHPGRQRVRPEDAHGLARLHQERLVVAERLERSHDGVERLPRARGTTRASVHDQILGSFGHVGVEVVHEHAHRGLLGPRTARQLRSAWGANLACAHPRSSAGSSAKIRQIRCFGLADDTPVGGCARVELAGSSG